MAMDDLTINGRLTIPQSEIELRFTTSSGPGGQHANKAATRVVLSLDVEHSPTLRAALSEAEHARLVGRLRSRLDGAGVLQVAAQDARSQSQNRQIALERLRQLLSDALQAPRPRRKSRPGRAARERRLAEKKRRGQIKKERGQRWDPSG